MNFRLLIATAAVVVAISGPRRVGSQAPGDRVRVHLVGLRQMEDTVVGWVGDSLLALKTASVRRNDIMHLERWAPQPFMLNWLRYTSRSMLATMPLLLIRRRDSAGHYERPIAPLTLLAINHGVGFGIAVIGRIAHWGRWQPVSSLPVR